MKDALLGEIKEDLLWDPVLVEDITEEEGTFKKELQVQILKTIDLFFLLISGMRLFRFLADFRYFQGKFHHFCESSKSGLKFYRGEGRGSGDGL